MIGTGIDEGDGLCVCVCNEVGDINNNVEIKSPLITHHRYELHSRCTHAKSIDLKSIAIMSTFASFILNRILLSHSFLFIIIIIIIIIIINIIDTHTHVQRTSSISIEREESPRVVQNPSTQSEDKKRERMAPSSHALPVIPLETFLTNTTSKEALEACETVAQELRHKGILIVRDPRVSEADNAAFLDLLERYFARDECDRMRDVRGDIGYQVGATPAGVEMPRCATDEDCLKRIDDIPEEENKPQVRRFFSLPFSPSLLLSLLLRVRTLSLSLSLYASSSRFTLATHTRVHMYTSHGTIANDAYTRCLCV